MPLFKDLPFLHKKITSVDNCNCYMKCNAVIFLKLWQPNNFHKNKRTFRNRKYINIQVGKTRPTVIILNNIKVIQYLILKTEHLCLVLLQQLSCNREGISEDKMEWPIPVIVANNNKQIKLIQ